MFRENEKGDFSSYNIESNALVLKSIEHHPEGAIVKASQVEQGVAIGYVLLATGIAILAGVLNFAGRDNAFERMTDTATTATFLLVSVFGLAKLKSEDDNVIRNTLLGYKLLRTGGDVEKYYMSHESTVGERGRRVVVAGAECETTGRGDDEEAESLCS